MINRSLITLLLLVTTLMGEQKKEVIDYEITYLSIPLLDMELTWVEDDTSISVSYDNKVKPFINIIHSVHNIYRVHFMKPDFAPLSWSKTIREGNMHFRLSAHRSKEGTQVSYSNGFDVDFPAGGFTIFSATHYLAANAQNKNLFPMQIPVFIDGEIWEVTAKRYDSKDQHPDYGVKGDEILIQAELHYLAGSPLVETNDILTDHIAREGSQFLLWVSEGVYTKAQFGRFPSAVTLRLVKN